MTCNCGHMDDEHDGDAVADPADSACNGDGCECVAFDWDGEDD